jgi:hypothetical protein
MDRYQALCSIPNKRTHLICHVEELGALPAHVRQLGPWRLSCTGEIGRLKREYRRALSENGYALVRCELAVFKPEA